MAPLFSQVDVTTGSQPHTSMNPVEEQGELLREMLTAQDRTNELLEELVGAFSAQNKQRSAELGQWKKANPELSRNCREAAETLSQVQVEYLDRLTEDVRDSQDELVYGDFLINEFVDRYGPRLAHLNGVIQVLAQLGSGASPSATQQDS
ncbi:hypothetical protein [Pseudobythopirellula maris]|nr:hypothetical protein [Pseudobythopirellula maris]